MRAGSRRGILADGSASVTRPPPPPPAPAGSTDPHDGEHHQDHEAEYDARPDDVQPQPGQMSRLTPIHHPHDRAAGDQKGAEHDRHGGHHRQDDD
jgi:hypothetical protein